MTIDHPSNQKSPGQSNTGRLPGRPDDEDDLFTDPMPLDPDADFEQALERVLSRDRVVPSVPRGARPAAGPQASTKSGSDHGYAADQDPFDRFSGTPAARDLEALARLAAEDRKREAEALEDAPEETAAESAGRFPDWIVLAGAVTALLGVLLGGAGLYTAWRHSGQLERIEARLGAPEAVGEPTPKGASGTEMLTQAAGLRSLREELSTLSDQLRTQAAEDRHNLQMALREFGPPFEQRRKAPEAAVDETTRSGDPPATRGAPRAVPPQTAAAAPKSNDVTKPPPVRPSTGPWAIAVGSFTDPAAATQEVERLRGLGVAAEIQAVQTESKTWHRISVVGFPSREAAQAYANSAKANPRLARIFADYWIGKR